MSYGATGNRTTDDTAAINTALAAVATAGGGVLYLPAGFYSLQSTSALTYNSTSPLIIQGDGMGVSALCLATAATSYTGLTISNAARVGLRDFSILTDA